MPESVVKKTIETMTARATRRRVTASERSITERMANLHATGWGKPKTGKTHIGLGARSDEVYLSIPADPKDPFAQPTKGDVFIPSKPLLVAHANFDRPADTVLENLPQDYDYIEERFYLDDDGNELVIPTDADIVRLLQRLREFISDMSGWADMFVLDGGTIIWDDVRTIRLGEPAGKDPDGGTKHLPRQYGPANSEMRHTVMQILYQGNFHSWLTLEAGEKWSGQNKPDVDEFGNPVMRLDGWNRTGYYSDLIGQVRLVELRNTRNELEWTRQYIIGEESIKTELIGRTFNKPTFAQIYHQTVPGVPFLRREDKERFAELYAEHGSTLAWG